MHFLFGHRFWSWCKTIGDFMNHFQALEINFFVLGASETGWEGVKCLLKPLGFFITSKMKFQNLRTDKCLNTILVIIKFFEFSHGKIVPTASTTKMRRRANYWNYRKNALVFWWCLSLIGMRLKRGYFSWIIFNLMNWCLACCWS